MSTIPNMQSNEEQKAHWKNTPSFRAGDTPQYSGTASVSNGLLHRIAINHLGRVSNPPDDIRLRRELTEILKDCSEDDWDGYGAKPICLDSVRGVSMFISFLPDYISYPELAPEPSGELTMIWNKRGYYIVIGINSEGIISYGGTSPNGRIYGDTKMLEVSNKIPDELIELLELIDGR